ncbi:NB-ARC domain, LRR domain containing protein [Trema orientale]|uniref:NB-ARC domain, LRR domain containing protein n=1 Tax=Trema orientale TaxID=63057 RepID=A0A2P5F7E1_TREOI|nr:NB-ARC domain, LRR domain containing protein [Trema orientale]
MADLVLSSVLQVIVDRLTTFVQEKFGSLLDIKEDMEKLQATLPMIQAVLEDAEAKRATKPAVRIWLSQLEDVAYEAEGLLLLLSHGSSFMNRQYANKVKETLRTLEKAVDEGLGINLRESVADPGEWECRRETSSFVVESDVYGREEDREKIVELLLSSEAIQGGGGGGGTVSCIAIIGMGGLGKTTLAQLAYNDEKVIQHFDVRVWVFVSDHFDVTNIMITVIESLTKDKCYNSNMDALHLSVRSLLRNKRYLIVLDDVWTEDQDDWDKLRPLFCGGVDGSKILITTRSKRVAFVATFPMFPYNLKELSEDACMSLFTQRAFRQGEEAKHPTLLPIGQQIVRKCGGLALAAKALGSLMRFKRDVREWLFVRDSELWNLSEYESRILPALKLSYSHLPIHLKRCLSFCSIFPRNYEFKKEKLIRLWMAEGLIQPNSSSGGKEKEDVGNDYFTDLLWMSFFQEIKQYENGVVIGYKMHDIIYDLLQFVTSSEYTIRQQCGFGTATSSKRIRHASVVCDFRSSTIPEDLYEAGHRLRTLLLFSEGEKQDTFLLGYLMLRGSLKITNLENIDIRWMFGFKPTSQIESLGLYWGSDDGCPNITLEDESMIGRFKERKQTDSSRPKQWIPYNPVKGEVVLEKLKPSHYLKRLLIKGYPGFKFPSWDVPYLNMVDLISCNRSKYLPTLGNLQFLTSLSLREMHGIRCIGREFYSEGNKKPFPVLKELVLVDFPNLEEWLSPDVDGDAFPNLRKLVINKCPKLTVMPPILSLRHLDIRDCNAVVLDSFQNLRSLEALVIEEVRDLYYFSGAFPINNPLLKTLEIKSCPCLCFLPNDWENLDALKSLVIRWCGKLNSLPRSMQYLRALESLEIGDCHSLTSLPDGGNRGLTNLRSLSIENCNNLNSLSMGFRHLTSLEVLTIMYCPSVVALPQSVEHLSALRSLSILCCPQLAFLPEELQNLMLLHSLEIRSCPGLTVIPEWIGKLVSLRSLAISDRRSVTLLPEGIKRLTALQHLSIQECPLLQQRCKPQCGEDWPKIAHVPYKHIESPKLIKRPGEEGSSSSHD